MAGLGTTGVLIGSFFLLLTVGSTLVAFRGVPGPASNGDLSRIELRQQREAAAAQRAGGLLAASNFVVDTTTGGSRHAGASGDVFGRLASGSSEQPDREHPPGRQLKPRFRLGPPRCARRTGRREGPEHRQPDPRPGLWHRWWIEAPVDQGALADDGSQPSTDTGTGTSSGTDSGTDSSGGSGTGSTDSGTDSSGTDSGSTGTGGTGGTVGDTVGDATGAVGGTVGTVSPSTGQTVTDTGAAVGGLLDDATSAVDGLTAGLGS